ncbi:MAG: PilZ domain-containing protein [Nitrospira sp.]|nr:PilZ domain-containing protein [Nitrospira sp.]
MDTRKAKRKIVNLDARLKVGEESFASSIENLSDEGIYLITAPAKKPITFSSDTQASLKFVLPSGETQLLECKIKWSYVTPPHGFTTSVGLSIINPPESYMKCLGHFQ